MPENCCFVALQFRKMAIHTFECIDGHTCGNPVRLVLTGKPNLKGLMAEKRIQFIENHDWIRQSLMFEPRGHDMMSGGFFYPPDDPHNDVGILFMETSGCLPMCGHGTIGLITLMIEEKLIVPKTEGAVRLETPAGLVKVKYQKDGEKVKSVKLTNVPAFLHSADLEVTCPNLGTLKVDVAFGGNFYAIVDIQNNFTGIDDFETGQLISFSREIRGQLNGLHQFIHPEDERMNGLSHVLWAGDSLSGNAHARNAVFYGDKGIDRSPCGTGTSARMAQWVAKGKLTEGETFVHESIIGSQFIGKVESLTKVGEYSAIIPSIEGWAVKTGYNKIIVDQDDPFAHGFTVL